MQIIDRHLIDQELAQPIDCSPSRVRDILAKARELKGISYHDVLTLIQVSDPELTDEIYQAARFAKNEIYGNRVVLFAPLYISNLCKNECLYCAFRSANKEVHRKALSQEEIRQETEILVSQGHKRVLLVGGESYPREGLKYIFDSIETVYSVHSPKGNIRRVNVNIAPLQVEEFRELKKYKIGTYQIFQETYHEETYKKLHLRGPKADYQFRLETIDRAFEAGIEDVGIGILFGLHDWRFEILALLNHIKHLEQKFGLGPHTISLPRIEPATGSELSYNPPAMVSDSDFKKIIAVLRLAVPYTGMILSTRENAMTRREALAMGISQISAGSKTNPGGYSEDAPDDGQFSLGDTRPLIEVIRDIVQEGYVPSFCTGCYRLGRVGKDFMDLAKPGLIKQHCLPNALMTFAEYLHDFGDASLQGTGFELIDRLAKTEISKDALRKNVTDRLLRIQKGERDLYF